jgi:hypothetical protein
MPYSVSARYVTLMRSHAILKSCCFLNPETFFLNYFWAFSVSLSAKADAKISGLFLTFQIKFEKVLLYFFGFLPALKACSFLPKTTLIMSYFSFPSRAFRDWECKGKRSF